MAHIVAIEPARSSGMLGLLLAFFLALPAATLRHWAPRTSGLLWALAAVVVVAALVIVVTSGESIAVRFLTMLVALDVGTRLVLRGRDRAAR